MGTKLDCNVVFAVFWNLLGTQFGGYWWDLDALTVYLGAFTVYLGGLPLISPWGGPRRYLCGHVGPKSHWKRIKIFITFGIGFSAFWLSELEAKCIRHWREIPLERHACFHMILSRVLGGFWNQFVALPRHGKAWKFASRVGEKLIFDIFHMFILMELWARYGSKMDGFLDSFGRRFVKYLTAF